jgi:hypothetical protein
MVQKKEQDGIPMDRTEFEHVKAFLHRMESYIAPISLKIAIHDTDQAGPGWGRTAFHKINKLISRAWKAAMNATPPEERFSSMADFDFMHSAIKSHFQPILVSYGLTREGADDALADISVGDVADNVWNMRGDALRGSMLPLCRHTESEEMAVDNLMALTSLGHTRIGAMMSMIGEDCARSILNAIASGHGHGGDKEQEMVLIIVGSRMLQLGHAIPEQAFRMIISRPAGVIADALFQISSEFSLDQLSGQARKQFSELLSAASTTDYAQMMYPVQFGLSAESTEQMAENMKKGQMTYI